MKHIVLNRVKQFFFFHDDSFLLKKILQNSIIEAPIDTLSNLNYRNIIEKIQRLCMKRQICVVFGNNIVEKKGY